MRAALGVFLIVATIACGIWLDIRFMIVGGIELIVRGVQLHPMNGSDIAWGIVRAVVLDGVFIAGAVVISMGWAALLLGRGRFARRRRVNLGPSRTRLPRDPGSPWAR
jgi:hypothetical protein